MVEEVFAGFVVGYGLSIVVAPLVAWGVVRANDRSGFAQRMAPPGTNVVALAVVLHFTMIFVFTAIGMALGMLLGALNDRQPDGGLGSPNQAYTLIVVALMAAVVIPTLIVPAIRQYAVAFGIMGAIAFGWIVPWLAEAR